MAKKLTVVLCVIVIAGGAFFMVASDVFGLRGRPGDITRQPQDYSALEAYLKGTSSKIVKVTSTEICSTNPTAAAVAGSLITYYASVTGTTESGQSVTERCGDVTISKLFDDLKQLRKNTIVVYDTDTQLKAARVRVSFCGVTKLFYYAVVKQPVSSSNYAILANPYTGTGKDYTPAPLTQSSNVHYVHAGAANVNYMLPDATGALESMVAAAKRDGFTLWGCSGYRPYSMQKTLYDAAVRSLGPDQNDTAKPGHSEHQTGLTMDISWPGAGGGLSVSMKDHKEYKWLLENSYKYGFILRYPQGSDDLTGYMFEPWHFRYIGTELAALFHESGMEVLDEFLSIPRW